MSGAHGELGPWGGAREMGELEATMWRAGRHPQNSTQGAVLEIFESTPDWSDVRRLHLDGLPRFHDSASASSSWPCRSGRRFGSTKGTSIPTITCVVSSCPSSEPFETGSTVEGIYYFAPLPGCHIWAVLFSYNGGCNIGINCDEEVFDDGDHLLSCLRAGIDEVLELRHHPSRKP